MPVEPNAVRSIAGIGMAAFLRPSPGSGGRDAAGREALEEAGVVGRIVGKRSTGFVHYTKRLPDDREVLLCRVKVFVLVGRSPTR